MSHFTGRRAAAKCSICGAPAVARVPYARLTLCSRHFMEFIERKVERVLRRAGALRRGARLLAAVSGGKDSAAMLTALARITKSNGVEVVGLHLVLGFGPYSRKSREAAEEACRVNNIPCIVLDLEEVLGAPVQAIARRARRPVCSVCGLIKRYVINAAAVELGADYVAMGHNADDIIAYTVKMFLNQDLAAIAKLGPSTESIDSLAVARLRPLYEVTEKESLLYAILSSTPFLHEECPFRPVTPIEERVKEFMNRVEEEHPGMKINYIRRLESNIELYKKIAGIEDWDIQQCQSCGLLSAGNECSFCRLTRRTLGEAKGAYIRRVIRELAAGLATRNS
ncbi:MAG TPA: adenine nucleotide alpha hydrolase family protein [Pyrodictium delaneyi]|uniref:Adenine nucleotide alpha hydrolase family protein n=1 Tax=Pyrodictium delaneyi TaxID=1273541 RepID=A0A832ZTX4_9CREN|nr:adenine nucleotide alpha hydrolase family protein [Pyrodictium delaneyi]